jgi:hypothetical protein
MTGVRLRRSVGLTAVGVLTVGAVALHNAAAVALYQISLATGALLFLMIVTATLLNVRKKVPFLPLGNATDWLTLHMVVGLATVVVYAIHTGGRWPNGVLELALAATYWSVILTGTAGWALSRWLAPRLARRGENVLFERIGRFRAQLRAEAETLVLRAASEFGSTTLPDFYAQRLADFFDRPRHLVSHAVASDHPRHALLGEVELLRRYLNAGEREVLDGLCELIYAKDDLDYQYSGQAILKYWLFVHIPLTYALVVLGLVHGITSGAFSGGLL